MPAFDACRSTDGKNSALFLAGCRFAGNLDLTDAEVAWWIRGQNDTHGVYRASLITPAALPATEVEGIIRSINGHYRPQWRNRGSQLPFVDRQRWKGSKGGHANTTEQQAAKGAKGGRPRIYASDADRLRAWRERTRSETKASLHR